MSDLTTPPTVSHNRRLTRTLNRRTFLLSLGALSGGAALLAACGGTSSTATVAPVTSAAPSANAAISAAPSIAPTTAATASASTATSGTAASPPTAAAATASRAASATASGTAQDATPKIVAAANAFLATLDSTQKASVQFEWSNTAQKQRWSNLPEVLYTRVGLMWGNLNDAQRNAWLAIMQATLSAEGYNRVIAEWNADDALATQEGSGTATTGTASGTATTGGAGGPAPVRGTGGPQGGTGGAPPVGGALVAPAAADCSTVSNIIGSR